MYNELALKFIHWIKSESFTSGITIVQYMLWTGYVILCCLTLISLLVLWLYFLLLLKYFLIIYHSKKCLCNFLKIIPWLFFDVTNKHKMFGPCQNFSQCKCLLLRFLHYSMTGNVFVYMMTSQRDWSIVTSLIHLCVNEYKRMLDLRVDLLKNDFPEIHTKREK